MITQILQQLHAPSMTALQPIPFALATQPQPMGRLSNRVINMEYSEIKTGQDRPVSTHPQAHPVRPLLVKRTQSQGQGHRSSQEEELTVPTGEQVLLNTVNLAELGRQFNAIEEAEEEDFEHSPFTAEEGDGSIVLQRSRVDYHPMILSEHACPPFVTVTPLALMTLKNHLVDLRREHLQIMETVEEQRRYFVETIHSLELAVEKGAVKRQQSEYTDNLMLKTGFIGFGSDQLKETNSLRKELNEALSQIEALTQQNESLEELKFDYTQKLSLMGLQVEKQVSERVRVVEEASLLKVEEKNRTIRRLMGELQQIEADLNSRGDLNKRERQLAARERVLLDSEVQLKNQQAELLAETKDLSLKKDGMKQREQELQTAEENMAERIARIEEEQERLKNWEEQLENKERAMNNSELLEKLSNIQTFNQESRRIKTPAIATPPKPRSSLQDHHRPFLQYLTHSGQTSPKRTPELMDSNKRVLNVFQDEARESIRHMDNPNVQEIGHSFLKNRPMQKTHYIVNTSPTKVQTQRGSHRAKFSPSSFIHKMVYSKRSLVMNSSSKHYSPSRPLKTESREKSPKNYVSPVGSKHSKSPMSGRPRHKRMQTGVNLSTKIERLKNELIREIDHMRH